MRILVVDDNLANREVARLVLTREGCSVLTAEDGFAARALANAGHYDAILMDIQMPGMCGQAATCHMRMVETDSYRPPIFALTAFSSQAAIATYRAQGLDGVLAKPFNIAEFRKMLAAFRPLHTLDSRIYLRRAHRNGNVSTLRHATRHIDDAFKITSDAPQQTVMDMMFEADDLGLSALSRALRSLMEAGSDWESTALSLVKHEACTAAKLFGHAHPAQPSVTRAAIPFPGKDARSASIQTRPSRPKSPFRHS